MFKKCSRVNAYKRFLNIFVNAFKAVFTPSCLKIVAAHVLGLPLKLRLFELNKPT